MGRLNMYTAALSSRKLCKAKRKYPVYEHELFVITYCCKVFMHCVQNTSRDNRHQSLECYFDTEKNLRSRWQHWLNIFAEHSLAVVPIHRKNEVVADVSSTQCEL